MEINEIVINAELTPGQVSFNNFEDLKSNLQQGLSVYKTTEYSADNIPQAEQDVKELKAIKKRLSDKKKELEAAYSMPIEKVKKQIDELISLVNEPLDMIDKLIKENAKRIKEQEILTYAKEKSSVLGEYAERVLNSRGFFNPKWLNSTYKTKDWQEDVNKIIRDTSDAIETIENVGGSNKAALMAFYFDKLSLDGSEVFLKSLSEDLSADSVSHAEDVDSVIGYKVLKIYGTERQMRQLMTQLSLSEYEFEELEDGMPKSMEELTDPTFDTFVSFDIEHTGTFGINKGDAESEIIEIGAVKVENGKIIEKFDMLANPGRKIVPMISRLTHITDEMVEAEPPVDEVIKAFKAFIGDHVLVGHNIKSCDIPHIVRAGKRAGVSIVNSFFDTKVLAQKLKNKKGWTSVTLPYLSEYYNVPQEEAHRAWCDAEANAYVYLELKKEIQG